VEDGIVARSTRAKQSGGAAGGKAARGKPAAPSAPAADHLAPKKNARRRDGRTPRALRPHTLEIGYQRHAEGSCLVRTGQTAVLCAVTVEEKLPSFLRGKGQGWITAEYAMLPRSTSQRTVRDGWRGRIGGRSHEIQRLIGRSIRAVADLTALGERALTIDCDVIEADGGTRTAAITGAFVAVAEALAGLETAGVLTGPVLKDYVAATSVGIVDNRVLVDLDYSEDFAAEVDMNVVMTGNGDFVEVQGTAEGRAFSNDELDTMLGAARAAIKKLVTAQRQALGRRDLP
jgi:ribonuclease PH